MSKALDQLLMKLGVQQKPLNIGQDHIRPNLKQYPIEYDFLDRVLYRFGSVLYGYRFYDTIDGTLEQAIAWSLDRKTNLENGESEEEWAKKLGINFLMLGPDTEDFRFVFNSGEVFLVFYHSFDGHYYPLLS